MITFSHVEIGITLVAWLIFQAYYAFMAESPFGRLVCFVGAVASGASYYTVARELGWLP